MLCKFHVDLWTKKCHSRRQADILYILTQKETKKKLLIAQWNLSTKSVIRLWDHNSFWQVQIISSCKFQVILKKQKFAWNHIGRAQKFHTVSDLVFPRQVLFRQIAFTSGKAQHFVNRKACSLYLHKWHPRCVEESHTISSWLIKPTVWEWYLTVFQISNESSKAVNVWTNRSFNNSTHLRNISLVVDDDVF